MISFGHDINIGFTERDGGLHQIIVLTFKVLIKFGKILTPPQDFLRHRRQQKTLNVNMHFMVLFIYRTNDCTGLITIH